VRQLQAVGIPEGTRETRRVNYELRQRRVEARVGGYGTSVYACIGREGMERASFV
jgi:hypothetical protein